MNSKGYLVFLTTYISKKCGNIKNGCRNISAHRLLQLLLHLTAFSVTIKVFVRSLQKKKKIFVRLFGG
jgi:hypothetical protein